MWERGGAVGLQAQPLLPRLPEIIRDGRRRARYRSWRLSVAHILQCVYGEASIGMAVNMPLSPPHLERGAYPAVCVYGGASNGMLVNMPHSLSSMPSICGGASLPLSAAQLSLCGGASLPADRRQIDASLPRVFLELRRRVAP